ncbi:MAG: dinitrogenase iron-molybdenum cofactor biosynthesis protein [Ruminococcus sp.]|nr:dinitrogenase iron-molybdenum cofactor biosynthesis protein [Ruminococcus sp.]
MALKIAIATNDGKTVNAHFGSAAQIVIYRAEGTKWSEGEAVVFENSPGTCSGNHDSAEERLLAVSECDYIIASRIGSRIQRYFEYNRQKYFEMPGAEISVILAKMLQYTQKLMQRKEV